MRRQALAHRREASDRRAPSASGSVRLAPAVMRGGPNAQHAQLTMQGRAPRAPQTRARRGSPLPPRSTARPLAGEEPSDEVASAATARVSDFQPRPRQDEECFAPRAARRGRARMRRTARMRASGAPLCCRRRRRRRARESHRAGAAGRALVARTHVSHLCAPRLRMHGDGHRRPGAPARERAEMVGAGTARTHTLQRVQRPATTRQATLDHSCVAPDRP